MGKKYLKIVLLVIGMMGFVSGIYGIIKGQDYINYSVGLICGSALIMGAFNLDKFVEK